MSKFFNYIIDFLLKYGYISIPFILCLLYLIPGLKIKGLDYWDNLAMTYVVALVIMIFDLGYKLRTKTIKESFDDGIYQISSVFIGLYLICYIIVITV
ncbi:MAG: hypothetical protein COC01_05965 [Bacteroidetes bacterium]|nr:MAG: hypothetical protein COC01_05965 [Bacteroidota bacterium]